MASSEVYTPLFPELEIEAAARSGTGVLPCQAIRELIRQERITANPAIEEQQIQPASVDLRLGEIAHRVQASFLPGPNATVESRIQNLRMVRVDLTKAAVLERGCVYIVPLVEQLNLPSNLSAKANPKSTTGRLDIFTRLITDYGVEFERVPPGYKGRLYAEIVPRTFTVRVRAGMRLSQLRFMRGNPLPADKLLKALDEQQSLVYHEGDVPARAQIDKGLKISVSLQGSAPGEVIAYRAKPNAPVVDLENVNHYDPEQFWEKVADDGSRRLILDPDTFYILGSKEKVCVPPEFAAEMVPFDPSVGEFRIHYAGFFDPGFGYGNNEIKGTKAVLEVRAHEVPFLIEDGQTVGRLIYLPLTAVADKIYGVDIGSSYQSQGLALSKHFKRQ